MKVKKALAQLTARYLGIDVSRYRRALTSLYLFDDWVGQLARTAPVQVVFDVGANRGQTVAHYRSVLPDSTIYAFEPGPAAFSGLQANTANDALAKPFRLALGEYDGETTLHENSANVTSSLLPNSSQIGRFTRAEMCVPTGASTVPIARIDSFFAQQSIRRIDLLKIDSQGYEKQILEGAGELLTPEHIRGLFVEVLFVDLYEKQTWFGDVLELLRARGYHLFGFTDIAADRENGWKWANAMFIGAEPDNR